MKIEWVQQCDSCQGTGLYVGFSRGGAAVVCTTCKGTGKQRNSVAYQEFTGRKKKEGVTRVYASSCGICLHPEVVPGGVSLDQWEEVPPSVKEHGTEIREHTCPAWYYQTVDDAQQPKWKECERSWGRRFSQCEHFGEKDKCWKRFDREALVKAGIVPENK